MSRPGQICYEPCTLVYTLIDPQILNFKDFSLLIRSMHTFMIENITPFESTNSVHVRLGYQASLKNARKKLGSAADVISVNKLSSHVAENEISRLEEIRARLGITYQEEEEEQPRRKKATTTRRFARPTPYGRSDKPGNSTFQPAVLPNGGDETDPE